MKRTILISLAAGVAIVPAPARRRRRQRILTRRRCSSRHPTASSTVDDRGGHGADDASTAPGTASPTSSASVDDRRGSGSDDVTAARRLSPREREVLVLVSQGMANKQIAPALGIAERTVKLHLNAVFRQLNVVDRTTAALWARENLGSW